MRDTAWVRPFGSRGRRQAMAYGRLGMYVLRFPVYSVLEFVLGFDKGLESGQGVLVGCEYD